MHYKVTATNIGSYNEVMQYLDAYAKAYNCAEGIRDVIWIGTTLSFYVIPNWG